MWIERTVALGILGMSLLFEYAYYVRYFKWRDCFNEVGRLYVPGEGVMLEQAGWVWSLLAAFSFGIFLYRSWKIMRLRR